MPANPNTKPVIELGLKRVGDTWLYLEQQTDYVSITKLTWFEALLCRLWANALANARLRLQNQRSR